MEGISMSRTRHYHEVWKASARPMEGIVTKGVAVLLCTDSKCLEVFRELSTFAAFNLKQSGYEETGIFIDGRVIVPHGVQDESAGACGETGRDVSGRGGR